MPVVQSNADATKSATRFADLRAAAPWTISPTAATGEVFYSL
jgi:hypothetical protein